jgi:hypothetical protein
LFTGGGRLEASRRPLRAGKLSRQPPDGITDTHYAHLVPAQKGWEQIADDALSWAVDHAR